MVSRSLVCVVDDDESVRESLPELLRSFGFEAAPFASAEAFLASGELSRAGCLVLDVAMPGMTGPELALELTRRGWDIPIVFITAHAGGEALRGVRPPGGAARLSKPFSGPEIVEAVKTALGES